MLSGIRLAGSPLSPRTWSVDPLRLRWRKEAGSRNKSGMTDGLAFRRNDLREHIKLFGLLCGA